MPNTYNVGAINSQLQDLNRSLFNSGVAMETGARNQAQADLIAKRGINEDLEAQKRRIEIGREAEMEAAVPGMVNAFVNMFSPMIPKRAVDAGVSVPLPPRRDEALAAAPVMEQALGPDGHSWAPGMNPTELLPAVRMDPAIAPDDLRSTVGGLVRMGVNKGDPNNLQNSIMNTIAALLGGVGEEADAFRAAAIRGNSTPVNQRFTLAGAKEAQEAQRGHEIEKTNIDANSREKTGVYAADQRLKGTIYSADKRAETAANREGKTPGSGKTPGLPQSPDETAKFSSLLKQRIAERNNGETNFSDKLVRSVEMEYERIKSENPNMSQSAAIELALDEHEFSLKDEWGPNNTVQGQKKGGGFAKPPAPGAQPAPAAKPAAVDVKDPATYEKVAKQIDALPLSPEEKARRKEILRQRINGGGKE